MSLHATAAQARRFLVARHRLLPPRAQRGVLGLIDHLGSLQFDPLEIPGARNHELVLHARIKGYRRGMCERWLYGKDRRLFEAWNKSLSILPLDELPYHRVIWRRGETVYGEVLAEHAADVERIVATIRERGPLPSTAFSRELSRAVTWGWGPARLGRVLVEALFLTGRVGIARREGATRYFDLIERLFPAEILALTVDDAAAKRHRILTRFRGVGLLAAGGAAEIATGLGTAAERRGGIAALAEDGALVPVTVAGVTGPRWILAGEARLFADPPGPPAGGGRVAFLGPLDPLMWDRRLVEELFGFSYRWEVYTPIAKRKHGYYVLPVLFGDKIVGRIEPRVDRKRGDLVIVMLAREPGFRGGAAWRAALEEALEAYRLFVGAERVSFAPAALRAR